MVRILGRFGVAACLVLALACPVGAQSPPAYEPTLLKAAAPLGSTNGLAFDAEDTLWVGHAAEKITKLDKDTGEVLQVFGPGPEWGTDDLAFGPDGALYHTALLNGTVGRLAPDGTHTSINSTPMPGVNPIAFSDDGRLFVGLAFMGDALYEFDPQGVAQPRLINEGLGLNGFDWLDGYLYAPRMWTGEVVRIDVDTGEHTQVAEGFAWPISIDVGPDGMLYVNDNAGGQIVKVDPKTGDKTVVADIAGDNMDFDSTGRIFLSNNDTGRLVEILADGGIREVIGGGLIGPAGIELMAAEDGQPTAFVGDIFSFHAVDATTGADLPVPNGELFEAMSMGAFGTNVVGSSWFSGILQVRDPATGEVVADLSSSLTGAPIDAIGFGDQVILSELGSDGPVVVAIDPGNGERTVLARMGVPSGLATEGGDLWAADWAAGTVSKLIEDGEAIEPIVVASGLAQPEGLDVAADGSLVVVETGARQVSRIDPATGETTPLIEGILSVPGPALMPPPFIMDDVSVDEAGSIYVKTNEGLTRYDPRG